MICFPSPVAINAPAGFKVRLLDFPLPRQFVLGKHRWRVVRRASPCSHCSSPLIRNMTRLRRSSSTLRFFTHASSASLAAQKIKAIARAYKVYYAKNEESKKFDSVIDHSGFVFLVGRDGKYLGFFPPGTSADRMFGSLRQQLAVTQQ